MRTIQELTEMLAPKSPEYIYKMGFDCGKNGPTLTNCHFALFSSPETTAEWERGNADGKRTAVKQAAP